MEAEKILVVDDNKEIVYSISELLKYEGYETLKAYDGMEALDIMERENVDLILLDVMMPRLNGLSALMKLREKSRIPVIILSAKTEESDKVSGLTLGADDYIEKPYNPAELIARVKAHLRRYRAWSGGETEKKKDPDQVVNGGLVLDKKQRVIFVEGEEVHLTATEYKILELLMAHPGQVFPAEQIYENVWQETADYVFCILQIGLCTPFLTPVPISQFHIPAYEQADSRLHQDIADQADSPYAPCTEIISVH